MRAIKENNDRKIKFRQKIHACNHLAHLNND